MAKKAKKDEQVREESSITSSISTLLTRQLADHKQSLLAEIKDTYAKYEAKLDSVQATVNDHQQRIEKLEQFADYIGDVDPRLTDMASENAKLKAKVIDLEGRSRRNNIGIIGLPENIEGSQPTAFFSQLLFDVLGTDVLTSPPELDRAHRTLTAKPGPSGKPRAVLICFHRFQTRELVVRVARKLRGKLKYDDHPIHILEDYTPEVMEQRAQYRDVMKKLYDLGLKPALRYPAKLFIVTADGSRKFLPGMKEAADFVASRRQDT